MLGSSSMKNANGILAVNNNDSIGHLRIRLMNLTFEIDFQGMIKANRAKATRAIPS